VTHDLEALRAGLAAIPADQLEPPATGRVGATLVLLTPTDDGHLSITYTRRQAHLSSHPGQISFPGGRVDPGEGIVAAALREAAEEVGLDPATTTVVGRLPAFYIPPSRFWMSAVVAVWERPHPLHPNPEEVADILTVSTAALHDPARWRSVPLSLRGASWAWDLGPQQLLWGATAVVTAVLLQVIDPGWSGGTQPQDLPVSRHVRPWEDPGASGIEPSRAASRPRLLDLPAEDLAVGDGGPAPDAAAAAADVAEAVIRLARRPEGPVVVLAGPGRTGAVARLAAQALRDGAAGAGPVEVLDVPGVDVAVVVEALARAGVVVDGLVGRGVDPPLRGPVLDVVRALSATGAPLVAVDLPSGIHPVLGLTGDSVSADVTIALAPLASAHAAPGALPFVGDLYLSRRDRPLVRAHVVDRPTAWAE
jgi:NAD(P)H-hydrate repair Nnr-like enzyme with NAD(P)H-hydrate epimerase domain/8-oxo-dGTP pyrophosphatase MutT (NUDIX family)